MFNPRHVLTLCLQLTVVFCCMPLEAQDKTIRFGHFPNLTHAQGLIAHQMSRSGEGWFEKRLGPQYKIEWYIYNAGPSAMEALFTRSLDLTYVGPSPVLNAYVKSKGRVVKVLAGAARGGSLLMLRQGLDLKNALDFKGRKIASPQLGNTQDIALRAWLKKAGLNITQQGGDAFVIPTASPDQLGLLKNKEIDAVWTVEPWASRLELELGAKVLLDDRSSISTVLAGSEKFISENLELVGRIVKANAELTDWINNNQAQAQKLLQDELKVETGKELPEALLQNAWKRVSFSAELDKQAFAQALSDAQLTGFLPTQVNYDNLLKTQW